MPLPHLSFSGFKFPRGVIARNRGQDRVYMRSNALRPGGDLLCIKGSTLVSLARRTSRTKMDDTVGLSLGLKKESHK